MVTIYVLTAVNWSHTFTGLRAYETKAEAENAMAEYPEWRADVLADFEKRSPIFSTNKDLCAARKHWFLKLPWGMRALKEDFVIDDLRVEDSAFETQADADFEVSAINAFAKSEETVLLYSLLGVL